MHLRDAAAGAALGASTSAAATLLLLRRYLQTELRLPILMHGPPRSGQVEDERLLQEVRMLLRDYWPHPIFEFSGYVSSGWTSMWAVLPTPVGPGPTERLTLQDGGTVSLHWSEPPAGGGNRVVLLLPGLNNDSRTSYVQGMMQHLRGCGFHTAALNYRGTGELELTSPRVGCLDSWRDIPEVVAHIEAKRPGADLFCVGFSMGGGMLLRHLGAVGAEVRFKAAVTIAGVVDPLKVSALLSSTLKKRTVSFIMANALKMLVFRKHWRSPFIEKVNKRGVLLARSIHEIDAAAICPLHGYRDPEDYYSSNAALPLLKNIAIKTMVVHAEDDPVVGISTLPLEELQRNPNIYAVITRRGGHIGWGSGGLGAGASWTDNMTGDFFQAFKNVATPDGARAGVAPQSRL